MTLRSDGSRREQKCVLLRIKSGQIHLQTYTRVNPGSSVHVRLDRASIAGVVDHSKQEQHGYVTCVLTSHEHRREPRFPVNLPCKVIVLGCKSTIPLPGNVADISESGLAIQIRSLIEIESIVCIETPDAVMAGEVRHCRKAGRGAFIAGIRITDSFPADIEPRHGLHVLE